MEKVNKAIWPYCVQETCKLVGRVEQYKGSLLHQINLELYKKIARAIESEDINSLKACFLELSTMLLVE